nr:DNA polymerase I [Treponemataceae bacterium]
MDKTLYIIDSYGLIYRSYYAFISRPLVNEKNENVSALYGFFNNLLSLIQKNDVKYMAAAFDSIGKTFRHVMYPEYKATRQKTPEDLHAQIPFIQETLEKAGVKILQNEGFEADDIIASLCKKANENGWNCRILSSDKDLMQLVNEKTSMIKSDKIGGWTLSGIEEVQKEWGVMPEQMLDILSLVGDTADNVPGVKGIGEKTAIKLL